MGDQSNQPIPDPFASPNCPSKERVKKFPFQISTNRLELGQNVNSAHVRTHWLALKWCNENRNVHLSPKPHMNESRSSTICAVVERPDHHCADGCNVIVIDRIVFLNFVLYGWSVIPFAYLVSFLFNVASTAYTRVLNIHIFTGTTTISFMRESGL